MGDRVGRIYGDAVVLHDTDGRARLAPARIDLDGRGAVRAVVEQDRRAFAASPEAAATLDLGRRLIAPAFVNAHTHLAMHALRGLGGDAARRGNVVEDLWFDIERGMTREDVRAFSRIGALECLLSGTGAVVDHYYESDGVAEALVEVGLEGVVADTLQDLGGPAHERWERALERTEARAADRALAERGVVTALGPHATDTVSDALWTRIVAMGRRLDLPVHVHVAQSREEVARARRAGFRSPLARLMAGGRLAGLRRCLVVHGIFVDDADIATLDPARDVLGHCPASQLQFAFPADVQPYADAGIGIALGTDAGASNDGMNVQKELLLLGHAAAYGVTWAAGGPTSSPDAAADWRDARRVEALDRRLARAAPEVVLEAVWGVPGTLHPQLPLGRIAAGYRGSVAVWDLDHPSVWPASDPLRSLAYGDPAGALHTLIVGGRLVGEVGDVRAVLRAPRVGAWIAEASERRAALLARAGGGDA